MYLVVSCRPTRWMGVVLPLLGVLMSVASARAQVGSRPGASVYPDFSNTADQLLRAAASHVAAEQWSEAVDLYQRVIQQFGDAVAPLPQDDPNVASNGDSKLYVDVRSYCQSRLASLPQDARALYRGRVDGQAEQWHRQGVEGRDLGLLRQVIDLAFCSSWGDDALEALGDLLFQDGRYTEALAAYRRLVPEEGSAAVGLVHPDPDVDRARVSAKKLIVRAAIGDSPPTPADLDRFSRDYPNSEGSLAGRTGSLREIVARVITEDRLSLPAQLDSRWSTFAGSPTRQRILSESIDVGSPQWAIKLPRVSSSQGVSLSRGGFTSQATSEPITAYHPIVLGDQVIVADDKSIRAFDLDERPESMEDVVWQYPPQGPLFTPPQARIPVRSARYSLTSAGDRIFARLGPTGAALRQGMSSLVAVERSKEGKFLWKLTARDLELPKRQNNAMGQTAIGFEGAPVADLRRVYVALSETGPRVSTWVACLSAETGKPLWIRFVCDAPLSGAENLGGIGMFNMPAIPPSWDSGMRMLTLEGGALYYQTNLGALACLDAETGKVRWVATYPRPERLPAGFADHDLSPAIVHDGFVYIAPADSTVICAFEAATGRLVWKSDELPKVEHLLGVARGRLIATGDHVWSLDAQTGKVLMSWPDSLTGFEGCGRGLLAGEWIYWPTRTEVHILDQTTGSRAANRPPIQLAQKFQQTGGNLVAGDGYLIIAGAETLAVYSQNRRLIQRYRDEIAQDPERALPYFQLAQVAQATGDQRLALESLDRTLAKATTNDLIEGRLLSEVARSRRYSLLMDLGVDALRRNEPIEAAGRFASAVTSATAGEERLTARLRLAEAHVQSGAPSEAVETLQSVLSDPSVASLTVPVDEMQTVRADLRVAALLETLIERFGRAVYARYDALAQDLLKNGKNRREPRALEEIERSYPAADCLSEALLALGRLHLENQEPAVAIKAFKRLLAKATDDRYHAIALLELAQGYENLEFWTLARNAYTQANDRFGTLRLPELGRDATVGELAAERLRREPLRQLGLSGEEFNHPVPLRRRWNRAWNEPHGFLEAVGIPPSAQIGRFFLVGGDELQSLNPGTGQVAWKARLSEKPIWAGFLADRLLVASESQIVAYDGHGMGPLWTFESATDRDGKADLNPFAKDAPETGRQSVTSSRLGSFHVMGDRLICQRGNQQILALEGESGLVAWSFSRTEGQINPHIMVGTGRVVAQWRNPHAMVVLDLTDGRCLAEFPQPPSTAEWSVSPQPIDDEQIVLALGPQTVALFDLQRGVEAWRCLEESPLPRSATPLIVSDAEHLLVLFGGNRLVRLDGRTGARLWSQTLGSEDLSKRPQALALDGRHVYFVNDLTLGSLSLIDGRPVWKRTLTEPAAGWSLQLTPQTIVTYPQPVSNTQFVLESLPLTIHRRQDGRLLQRVLISAPIRELAVSLHSQGALVATQAGLWSLGGRLDDEGGEGPR